MLVLPIVVFAHTEITSSTPETGQVVTEEPKEISLTFGGEIESLSTMTLVKDGQEISFTSVIPRGNQMIGTLSEPLDNGSYTIQWILLGSNHR